jgi:hypothetical protein
MRFSDPAAGRIARFLGISLSADARSVNAWSTRAVVCTDRAAICGDCPALISSLPRSRLNGLGQGFEE